MKDEYALQAAFNRETADSGAYFAPHRARVHALLMQARTGPEDRLLVLGAGNANDLELPALCRAFREVHLADIDGEALERAAAKAPDGTPGRLFLHAGTDLLAPGGAGDLPGGMDVVLSACVLSQLIAGLLRGKPERPQPVKAILALRKRHFQLMTSLSRPGGRGVFVTDMAGSHSAPEIADCPDPALRGLMDRLIADSNFFTGLNPRAAMQSLFMDRDLARAVGAIRFEGPWRWSISEMRCFLVYALTFSVRREAE